MAASSGASHRRGMPLTAAATGLTLMCALGVSATATAEPAPSKEQLKAASSAVLDADVAGTAWHIDQKTNRLVVTADSSVRAADMAKIKKSAGINVKSIHFERVSGKFRKYISGGDAIHDEKGSRCSAGFNVEKSDGSSYLVTAGHCTKEKGDWFTDAERQTRIGPSAGSSFPGNDYGLVQYSNDAVPHPGTVADVDITQAADPKVDQKVTRRGSTTGVKTGTVTGLDASVNYGNNEVVSGLIRTDLCAEPGDSGGPLYSGSTAHGITSGGSGNCNSGGTTFFQPVSEALKAYDVKLG